ncbi:MAG: hypothetical protein KAU31_16285, partial [Spirochaetaceae bacterium]|nr:hypothetical protein [Spirochaetaceae bacterium]
IALQEIEGRRVISDFTRDFLRGRYQVVMSPGSDGATQVALLSRFPLRSLRIHQSVAVAVCPAPIPRPPVERWSSREMVDAEIDVGRGGGLIRVIACHWKSQSGGERETEPQRIQSAALLRTLLVASTAGSAAAGSGSAPVGGELPTLIVGDLNEDVEEFRQHGGAYPTALMPDGAAVPGTAERGTAAPGAGRSLLVTSTPEAAGLRSDGVVLYSPWFASTADGSYYHAGRWERLDQVLVLPGSVRGARVSLRVVDDPELLTDDGRPARYAPRTGYGYSDHLPVEVQVSWGEVD